MNKDFTIKTYRLLLDAFLQKGYSFLTFEQWFENEDYTGKFIILRHDVDEMARNALTMAEIENSLGIKATYSFRIVKQSNQPEIIKKIVALGHEIGYHYEDLALADGDYEKAIKTFRENLNYFRTFYNVKTISMHGSSTSVYDNRDLWKKYDFKNEGIIGEPYLSVDYSQVYYLTDTGYCWDGYKISVRDHVLSSYKNSYHTTFDIIGSLQSDEFPPRVVMLAHTLWTDKKILWYYIYCRESLRNKVKLLALNNRLVRKVYGGLVRHYWHIK